MKDHYRTLDLPKGTSEEQIKAQYKRLVRVYHPDRFAKSDDKSYAEQKIKEINEAYNALLKTPGGSSTQLLGEQPVPVAIPPYIDFGSMIVGEKKAVPFTVSNARGAIEDLQFDFSETKWFTINESRMLTAQSTAPLQFEVVATTAAMLPGRIYKGWIDVRMKNTVTRVNLSLKVVREQADVSPTSTLIRNTAFGVILFGIAASATYLGPQYLTSAGTINPATANNNGAVAKAPEQRAMIAAEPTSLQQQGMALRGANPLLTSLVTNEGNDVASAFTENSDHLVYPIFDNNTLILYTATFDGENQQRFKFSGQSVAWSKDGRRIAYLLQKDGAKQIFVAHSADRTEDQLTNTTNEKSDLAWAADGSQLAYIQLEEPRRILYLTAPGGRSPRALSNPRSGSVGSFTWSPDSGMLLFGVENNGKHLIYQVHADGSGLKQFSTIDAYDPAWSPDGKVVLVASAKGLFALDSSGKQIRQLSTTAAQQPQWSPDGLQFAYIAGTSANNSSRELVIADMTDKQPEKVASGALLKFAWSPRSGRIAYVAGTLADSGLSTLYLWTVTAGERAKLVAETNDPFVTWVP